jgi:hypothetical protein
MVALTGFGPSFPTNHLAVVVLVSFEPLYHCLHCTGSSIDLTSRLDTVISILASSYCANAFVHTKYLVSTALGAFGSSVFE